MQRVFDLIDGAKQAVLFLAFDPGNNSILDAAGRALAKKPDLSCAARLPARNAP